MATINFEDFVKLEIKTKEELPRAENVVSLYPQDVEQIVFYSVMHPDKPKINYMIFVSTAW